MTSQTEADALRVEAHCTVAVEPEAAFSAFAAGLHTWWPRAYSWGPATLDRHELEPRTGGRVTEHTQDGGQLDWARVVEWNPPTRLVLHWVDRTGSRALSKRCAPSRAGPTSSRRSPPR